MVLAYSFFIGLFLTMVLIPILIKGSAWVPAIDYPSPRKVHTAPTPRVAGIAIAMGAGIAVLIWLPHDIFWLGYLLGVAVLLVQGIWDDIRPLDYRWKLFGQVIAAAIVMASGLVMDHLPFFGLDAVPWFIAYPATLVFLLAITNATNLFDGLDGLAGGCSLISFFAIGLLAYLSGDMFIPVVALAVIGGTFGFLRFNTYPAAVFMGDAGSQFLGFTAAFLVIHLTHNVNPALNPVLPLLLLGLPVFDTVSVIIRRILQGTSPFKGDRQHLHHRLLERSFRYIEVVSLLYLVQALMVVSAFLLLYQSDILVLTVFAIFAVLVFLPLYWAETRDRHMHSNGPGAVNGSLAEKYRAILGRVGWVETYGPDIVGIGIAVFLIAGAVLGDAPSKDVAGLSLGMALMLVIAFFFLRSWGYIFSRLGFYFVTLTAVFLLTSGSAENDVLKWLVNGYLMALVIPLGLAIVVARRPAFQANPQDLLMVFLLLTIPNLPLEVFGDFPISLLVLRTALLFYAIEVVMAERGRRLRLLQGAAFVSLVVIGLRGFL